MGGGSPQATFGRTPTRSTWGLFAELHLQPHPQWELEFGGRADAWITGSAAWGVVDPRASEGNFAVIVHRYGQLFLKESSG